ncbi:uncharacterized protein LOC117894374 [Drosophila subobscura]|uniref:uncharacterized protein LOC117894374 n=1 Tax=Drosophila subobscura TaxID=7241 RepID=UPI00155AE716|nr:uncharacterized protein LOC117894374 [Drosophila subobscura]
MTFGAELQSILEELLISDDDRSEYTRDAVELQNFVIEELKEADINFRKAFDGLSLTGSYLDGVKLKTPDEFDLHMKLKFPFPITPTKDEKGFVFLYANGSNHSIVTDNYINRKELQDWLRDAFDKVFDSELSVLCKSGEEYELMYTAKGTGCAHTIEAEGKNRNISFDFVPAFEFAWAQWPLDKTCIYNSRKKKLMYFPWFAVPQYKQGTWDDRIFMVCVPHWERQLTMDLHNFKNVLRLMKGLRDAHATDFPKLSSYMLKTVLLHKLGRVDWRTNLGTLFMKMWTFLVVHLQEGRLDFYFAKGHNVFDRMTHGELQKCNFTAKDLLSKLRKARDGKNNLELAKLFNVSK